MAQTGPVPIDPASWVTHDDYPVEALRAKEQGVVVLRMNVDAAGAMTGCTIVQSSGSAALDATSCRAMRERGRFTPATDADGRSVASTAERRIRWQLPTGADRALSPFAMSIRLTLGEKGRVLDCKTNGASADGATFDACQQQDGRYTSFPDAGFANYPPGLLIFSTRLEVEGVPFTPAPATGALSNIPPFFTQSDSFTVDATGKVIQCERTSSAKGGTEPCPTEDGYQATPDQPVRRGRITASTAFQPAK